MKKQTLVGYGVLLIVSLGLAYWASMPQKSNDDDRQSVFQISPDAITGIEFKSNEQKVLVDKVDGRYWITFQRNEKKKPDGSVDVAALNDRFLASNRLKEYFNKLSPLDAIRVLKNPEDKSLAEYGLDQSGKSFQVKKSGDAVELDLTVGKQSYGSQNLFVRDKSSKNVWLIDGDTIFDIEKADLRLFERNIMSFGSDEIKSAEIKVGQKTKTVSKTKRDQQGALAWSDEGEKAAPNAAYKNWFERFERLKVGVYAKEDQKAALEALPVLFSVTFENQIGSKELLTIRKTMVGTEEQYWLYSDFLKTFVSIPSSRMQQLDKDVKQVFGL